MTEARDVRTWVPSAGGSAGPQGRYALVLLRLLAALVPGVAVYAFPLTGREHVLTDDVLLGPASHVGAWPTTISGRLPAGTTVCDDNAWPFDLGLALGYSQKVHVVLRSPPSTRAPDSTGHIVEGKP